MMAPMPTVEPRGSSPSSSQCVSSTDYTCHSFPPPPFPLPSCLQWNRKGAPRGGSPNSSGASSAFLETHVDVSSQLGRDSDAPMRSGTSITTSASAKRLLQQADSGGGGRKGDDEQQQRGGK